MGKSLKRTSKPLILSGVVILVVSLVLVAVFVLAFTGDGADRSSGIFVMKSESRTNGGWSFTTQSAKGYSTIFRDLSQEDLDRFSVVSSIAEGELLLILSQGENSQSIDLSEGSLQLSAEDLGMEMFSPGRISIELKFTDAKNVDVTINWRLNLGR